MWSREKVKLVEIATPFTIETGAPSPTLVTDKNHLFLLFYYQQEQETGGYRYYELIERDTQNDTGVISIKFTNCVKHSFGFPSNETIAGHRYYKAGLGSYGFYEVSSSDWIKELIGIDQVHPYFNRAKWDSYSHYILTFHDSMFECIATGYEVEQHPDASMSEQVFAALRNIYP